MSPLGHLGARVRDSFWFVPALCALGAVALAEGLAALGRAVPLERSGSAFLLLAVGADGSRSLLGAIATAVLGAAATTFSITIAVLALTSSSYGPRLVRNFLADRGNQAVLGVLVSTALYALLVLRHIRVLDLESDEPAYVPHLAVNVAVLLALVSAGFLVYFIHHISVSIQVATLSSRVRGELLEILDDLYPEQPRPGSRAGGPLAPDGVPVRTQDDGYVVAVDHDRLVKAARQAGTVVDVTVRPGGFVVRGDVVARVGGAADGLDEGLLDTVRGAVAVGSSRTPYQDVRSVVRLHVDLALRALSPSTNDPITAMNAFDDLSAGLARVAGRPDPAPVLLDDEGVPRVHVAAVAVPELVTSTLDLARPYVVDHPDVVLHLLECCERIGRRARSRATADALLEQVDTLLEQCAAADHVDRDRLRIRERGDATRRVLGAS